MKTTQIKTNNPEALFVCLANHSRKELREFAKERGIKRGRDKKDTIRNLVYSGIGFKTVLVMGPFTKEDITTYECNIKFSIHNKPELKSS